MKKLVLLFICSSLCACVTAPAPIIVKDQPYHTLSNFQASPVQPQVVAQPPQRASRRSAAASFRQDDTSSFYPKAPHINRLRDPWSFLQNQSSNRTAHLLGSHGDRSLSYARQREMQGDARPEYRAATSGQQIQYVPVTVISVEQAPEQCDYTAQSQTQQFSGSAIPAWMDPRNSMAKNASAEMNSAGSDSLELRCRSGGYMLTYVGVNPKTGASFSGTVLSRRPPASSALNIPLSL